MRKNWLIALVGAALLAIVPASALAQGHHARHHAKRHHKVRTHLRHFTAASSGTTSSTGTSTSSTDNAGTVTSFDSTTGQLVITLTDNSPVTGIVNGNTELSCESASTQSSGDSSTMQSDTSFDGSGDQSSGDTPSSGDTQSSSSDQSSTSDQTDQGDQNEQGDSGSGQAACTTASLTPGTVVHEAELAVSSAGSVWRQVDLVIG